MSRLLLAVLTALLLAAPAFAQPVSFYDTFDSDVDGWEGAEGPTSPTCRFASGTLELPGQGVCLYDGGEAEGPQVSERDSWAAIITGNGSIAHWLGPGLRHKGTNHSAIEYFFIARFHSDGDAVVRVCNGNSQDASCVNLASVDIGLNENPGAGYFLAFHVAGEGVDTEFAVWGIAPGFTFDIESPQTWPAPNFCLSDNGTITDSQLTTICAGVPGVTWDGAPDSFAGYGYPAAGQTAAVAYSGSSNTKRFDEIAAGELQPPVITITVLSTTPADDCVIGFNCADIDISVVSQGTTGPTFDYRWDCDDSDGTPGIGGSPGTPEGEQLNFGSDTHTLLDACTYAVAGTYTITVEVEDDGTGLSNTRTVTINAADPVKRLTITPASQFAAVEQGTGQLAGWQAFTVENAGDPGAGTIVLNSLSFTSRQDITGNTDPPNDQWIDATDDCPGSIAEGQFCTVTLSESAPSDGDLGTWNATFTVDWDATTTDVEFSLNVTPPVPPGPKLNVTGGCNCTNSQLSAGGTYCTATGVTYTTEDGSYSAEVLFDDPDGAGPESNAYTCGQWANGDVWVAGKSDGLGGTVVAIADTIPAWDDVGSDSQGCAGCANGRNGWEIDTSVATYDSTSLDARFVNSGSWTAPTALPASFDVTAGYRSFSKASGIPSIAPGDPQRWDVCWDGNSGLCIGLEGVVTFVECATGCTYPADSDGDGSTADEFRPSFFGTPAQKISGVRVDQMEHLAELGQLDRTLISQAVRDGWSFGMVADSYRFLRRDHAQDAVWFQWILFGDRHADQSNTRPPGAVIWRRYEYGMDQMARNSIAVHRLLLDDWTLGSPGDDSYQALVNFTQVALDTVAITSISGKGWGTDAVKVGSGGHLGGRQLYFVWVGWMFENHPTHGAAFTAALAAKETYEDVMTHGGTNGVEYFGAIVGDCENTITTSTTGAAPDNHNCGVFKATDVPALLDSVCLRSQASGSTSYPHRNAFLSGYTVLPILNLGIRSYLDDDGYIDFAYSYREGGRQPGHTEGFWCEPDGPLQSPTPLVYGQNDINCCGGDQGSSDYGEAAWSAFKDFEPAGLPSPSIFGISGPYSTGGTHIEWR